MCERTDHVGSTATQPIQARRESCRLAQASLIAPFDYTSMLWALVLGFLVFGEVPSVLVFVGAGIIAGAGLFVIWRERQLALQRGKEKVSAE